VNEEMFLVAAECPRAGGDDIPAGWKARATLAATTMAGGFTLWTDGEGHWLRIDSARLTTSTQREQV
jgi:hypothetical protein